MHIEDYETLRSPRRSRQDLRLSDKDRRDILSGGIDYHSNSLVGRQFANIHSSPSSSSSSSLPIPQEDGLLLSPIDLKRAERRTYRNRERMRNRAFTNKFFACPME